jgi:hypothetical protein
MGQVEGWRSVPSLLEDQHQVGEEQEQMHRSEQDVGARASKREGAHSQRQDEQNRIDGVESEDDGLSRDETDRQHRWYGQADRGQRRSQQDVDGTLELVRQRRTSRAQGLRREDQSGENLDTALLAVPGD